MPFSGGRRLHTPVVAAILLATLAGCASHRHAATTASASAVARRQMLFGWWISRERLMGGGKRLRLALHCPDGVFFFDERTLDAGGKVVAESNQVGDWGISGPVFFAIVRGGRKNGQNYEADLNKGRYYQAYRIVKLTYTVFEYRSYATGTVVAARRASPDELSDLRDVEGTLELPSGCGDSEPDGPQGL